MSSLPVQAFHVTTGNCCGAILKLEIKTFLWLRSLRDCAHATILAMYLVWDEMNRRLILLFISCFHWGEQIARANSDWSGHTGCCHVTWSRGSRWVTTWTYVRQAIFLQAARNAVSMWCLGMLSAVSSLGLCPCCHVLGKTAWRQLSGTVWLCHDSKGRWWRMLRLNSSLVAYYGKPV